MARCLALECRCDPELWDLPGRITPSAWPLRALFVYEPISMASFLRVVIELASFQAECDRNLVRLPTQAFAFTAQN